MRAAVMRDGRLVVDELTDPEPGPGQVLVRTLACGICGSDLHALAHGERLVEMTTEVVAALPDAPILPQVMDLSRDVVMGHEFAAEVVDVGPGVAPGAVGDVVVSIPLVLDADGAHQVGYANAYPGGYAELMVLSHALTLIVPNGLAPRLASLTEPMAVGVHAVARAAMAPGDAAVVLGCGPVGLAVVAALAAAGVECIVAADFSPARRALAETMGAGAVVDPAAESAVDVWRRASGDAPLVIFEAVGVPGMLDEAMRVAPRMARIVVVGACMEPDRIQPMRGLARELTLTFALAYEPFEFATTLGRIAEGDLDVEPLITGSVAIDGVPGAFIELADPGRHAKILVEP